MKQFKKVLSLVLAVVLLLSCAYIGPMQADAAASDYIATSYAANLSVKTTKAVNLMPSPVSSATSTYTLPADTMLTVKALHKNTSGSYWYEVLYYDMTLYVDATATTLVDHLTGDVTIADVQSPASLAYGNSFGIEGEISSTLNDLGTITASMRPNTNISRGSVIEASDEANGKSYSLSGSAIDSNLVFGSMDPGIYTYVLTAEAISYYIDGDGALATSSQTVVLNTQQCVITDWTNPNDDLAFGIDVSVWQGSIDWSQVKNDVDFAILRIGFAETLDNRFLEYANGCEQYGIPYGVYLYSYALTAADATAEAEFVIDTLESYGYKPELPIWFDMEDSTQASLDETTQQALVTSFCDTIAAAGYQPGFYGFTSWFYTSFQNSYLSSIPVWIAQIDGFSSNGTATHDGGTWLWQYSWEGSISGISGDVDCNLCYFEYPGISSDTSYLAQCTYYPAHSIGTTTGSVNMRQYPSTSYTNLGTVASGTELEITGLYKNASGEYWYQVVNGSTVGYISASYITINEFLYDDLAVIDPAMASNINLGASYSLSGKLVSQYNSIYTTHAKIYSGEDTLADPVVSSSYTNDSKSYKLRKSTVCDNLSFGSLSAGYYTYEISADVNNYYVSGGSLTSATENVVLWTAPFTVGSAPIEPPAEVTCDHNIITDTAVTPGCTTTGLSEGSHCSKCGVVFTEQAVIPAAGHSYQANVSDGNCQAYATYTFTCSTCGDSYSHTANELANMWVTDIPDNMDESLFEVKTQYRYSDYVTKTSSESTMDGYTLKSSAWEASGTGTVNYVNSWPSGFSTSSSLYKQYNNKSSKVSASETANAKTVINSDAIVGYLYYHWCYTDSYYSMASSSGSYTTFHAYYSTTAPSNYTCDTSDYSYCTSHSTCSNSEWFFVTEVYGQSYTNYTKVYTFEGWTDYTDWSDTAVTASDTRKVESRTVYQLKEATLGNHQFVAGSCILCGEADPNAANIDYYLFGYIDGQDYACEGDYTNLGEYKFVDGTLTVTFMQDSYVAVKASDNVNWYMTDGWLGTDVTSAILYHTSTLSSADKLYVPGGVRVTFTLVNNGDNTFTLSYEAEERVIPPVLTPKYPSISIKDEVLMNVYFTATDIGSVSLEDIGILTWFTAPSNGTIDNAESVVPGVTYDSSTGYYRAHTAGIPAKNLGDTIYFRLYAKLSNGTYAYSDLLYYSVKTYATNILNSSSHGNDEKAVVVALLNYGAAAQTIFSYKPYKLVNADLTEAQKALVDDYRADMVASVGSVSSAKVGTFVSNGGYSKKYPSIVTGGAFSINYYFTTSATPSSNVTLYYWNQNDYASATTLTPENATGTLTMTDTGNNIYTATVGGISAKDLDGTIYVAGMYTATNGTTYCTGVLPYSIGSYCVSHSNSSDANVSQIAKCMAVYCYYAKTYFANN